MKRILWLLIIMGVLTSLIYAGDIRSLICTNQECDFKEEIFAGTGKLSTRLFGYCMQCQKMVTISFKNTELENGEPIHFTNVWNAATGEILDLYECPNCQKPFAAIYHMEHCPKCGKKTISDTVIGKWD